MEKAIVNQTLKKWVTSMFLVMLFVMGISKCIYSQVYQRQAQKIIMEPASLYETYQEYASVLIYIDAKKKIIRISGEKTFEYKIVKRHSAVEDEQGNYILLWDCKNRKGLDCSITFRQFNTGELKVYVSYKKDTPQDFLVSFKE